MNRSRTFPTAALLTAGLLAVPLVGCQSKQKEVAEWDDDARGSTNGWLLSSYYDTQIENGVVRQHTLWSHHFVDGTDVLNERGQRDLNILADHYRRYKGGVLNLPRNGTQRTLYERRTASVRETLASAGVDVGSVVFDTETWTGQTQPSIRAGADVVRPSDDKPYNFHEADAAN